MELADTSVEILLKYYNDKNFAYSSKQSTPGRCKYILYGMICHLLGDIYAHKVMLTKTAAKHLQNKVTKADITKMFDKSDFSSKYYDITGLINCLTADPSVTYNDKDKIKTISTNDVKTFIKKTIDANKKKALKKKLNQKYIDSNQFYPNRTKDATLAISSFLNKYPDSIDLKIIKSHYGFDLYKSKKYKSELGLN